MGNTENPLRQNLILISATEDGQPRVDVMDGVKAVSYTHLAVSTDARREALNKLEQKYPDIFSKYDTEYEKLKNINKIK